LKKSNSLKDRLKKSYESKDKGGGSRPSAFDWKKADGVKFYKAKEGKNRINIIPYIVKTKNDPLVRAGDTKVGDQSYMLDVFIHRNIGPTQAEVICPKSNFGKPCPICKQAQEFKDNGKKDEASALWPKRQCFYNVIDGKNPDEGIQIFAISHYLFEKELIEEARAASDDGDIIDFVDIDDGKMIEFRGAETTSNINGKAVTFLEYKSFVFKEREESLDSDLVEKAISFDDLMKLPSDDEIKALMFGDDDAEADDEEVEEEDDDEEESPKNKNIKRDKKASKEAEEEEEESEEDDDDVPENDQDDDEEEDEKPVKKQPAKAKKEPPKKPQKGLCPKGLKYGVDCNSKKCDDECDEWAEYLKEQNKLKKKK